MMTKVDRRAEAMLELLMTAADIGDKHGVCPVCLLLAASGGTSDAVKRGDLDHLTKRHFGDEQGTAH